jgi:hypothetical protein
MRGDRVDFFVSHAGADRAWAEWVAWQLTDAGYSVELDVWDWAAGRNFVAAMSDALDRADRIVALFSAAYFERERYTALEWASSVVQVSGMGQGRLVPVRVEDVPSGKVPAVLRPLVSRDLFGLAEEAARGNLLAAVAGPSRPASRPPFPGLPDHLGRLDGTGPRLPGTMPAAWGNVPARNPAFTGRDQMLVDVRERLLGGNRTVVQALHGMGGVGKTQLAAEYAHRFSGGYDLVWWITAENSSLIGEQFAEMADVLGCARPGAGLAAMRRAVLAMLRQRDRWLLVFDNAEDPEELAQWLPGGSGHVLITSRAARWAGIAVPVEVDVLARAESMAILLKQVVSLSAVDAEKVASALGDLPLAIAQAAGFMADTGIPAAEYLGLLAVRAEGILDHGRPALYPESLAAVTQFAFDKLLGENPAAARLAELCAYLAPEPVPAEWFPPATAHLPAPLDGQSADPVGWRQVLAVLGRYALARIDGQGLQMHRLTQAILRSHMPHAEAADTRARAGAILTANHPGDPRAPQCWPRWARLLPHLLILEPAADASGKLCELACDAAEYLTWRGDARGGYALARSLFRQRREHHGADDPLTLKAAATLALTMRKTGRYGETGPMDETFGPKETRELEDDTLARRRLVLGPDHPDTLWSASSLATSLRALGEAAAARDLDQDTLSRSRRVLGEDHPSTLWFANGLAADLRALGQAQAARDLDQDTMARRRRVLGEDHPDALWSAFNLAKDLRELGDPQAARDLDQDTLARRRRVLGEDHPDTLRSAAIVHAPQPHHDDR